LDGGDCGVGVESTVVNGLAWKEGGGGHVDVLRPGGLGVEDIQKVVVQLDGAERKTEMRLHGKPWMRNAAASSSRLPDREPAETKLPPSTPGMKYRHYSPRVPVYLLLPSNTFPRPPVTTSSNLRAVLEPIIASLPNGRRPRFGLLHYEGSPLSRRILEEVDGADFLPVSLGADSTSAAQRLFSGMLSLEGGRLPANDDVSDLATTGVDAIFVEGCSDEGLGLAVMERVGKAVGGGGKSGELGNGEGEGSSGRFWVEV
jgi:L-threonylcarbamoyladenylate synthase